MKAKLIVFKSNINKSKPVNSQNKISPQKKEYNINTYVSEKRKKEIRNYILNNESHF